MEGGHPPTEAQQALCGNRPQRTHPPPTRRVA
jgi:hypothetical protein